MNTEINTNAPKKGKKKFSKKPANKIFRPSVTYLPEELFETSESKFWQSVHNATIKELREDGALVEIESLGKNVLAMVKKEELFQKDLKVGDNIEVFLEDELESLGGELTCFRASQIKAMDIKFLEKAEKAHKDHELVEGYVVGQIKGGYAMALFAKSREEAEQGIGLRAFLPFTQTSIRKTEGLTEKESPFFSVFITDIKPSLGNIVVSRREILVNQKKEGQEAFLKEHKIGDIVSGQVSAQMPYGLFVNLGPVDGFLHISDISWGKKLRASDLPKVSESITAKIIGIDEENKKVKLSIKELNVDPWQNIDRLYRPGMEVLGTIVAFADFGAFVSLEKGVEGLVHLGEITWSRIKHPSNHFKIGDEVKALVLRVDKETKRISLSTKALEQSPVERLSGQFPVGAVLKTKVASIHDFGLFVELDKETNGLVPKSEVSWMRIDEPLENFYKPGQEVEVAVLGYDSQRQRVSCSMKRLKEDPWPVWKDKYKKGSLHKVKVVSINKFGANCELEPGLLAFCPRKELVLTESEISRPIIKEGEEMETLVIQFDFLRHKISISQRAVAETETKKAYADYVSGQKAAQKTTLGDAFKNINIKK